MFFSGGGAGRKVGGWSFFGCGRKAGRQVGWSWISFEAAPRVPLLAKTAARPGGAGQGDEAGWAQGFLD